MDIPNVPLVAEVEVVVVGGSSAGAACAVAAARAGARVLLVAPRPYVGDDLCAHWRLWPDEAEVPTTALARAVFAGDLPPTPLHVKRTLEQALVEAGVGLVLAAQPAGVLRDGDGRVAGVLIADRAGVQAVRAGAVVDATHRALVARQAGAACLPWPVGPVIAERVLVGGAALQVEGVETVERPTPVTAVDAQGAVRTWPAIAYRFPLTLVAPTPAAWAEAETTARLRIWHEGQVFSSESLWVLPPDPLAAGPHHVEAWPGAEALDLRCLAVADEPLHVLGPCADLSREAAAHLAEPCAGMAVGERLGRRLAATTRVLPGPVVAGFPEGPAQVFAGLRIPHQGLRPVGAMPGRVLLREHTLPLLAEVDVLVVGGGTAGAPAAIAAARRGARTLVTELLPDLGGCGTHGLIARYHHGNRVGFTAEADAGVAAMTPGCTSPTQGGVWNVEHRMAWWLRECRRSGAAVWTRTLACGALVEGGAVRGAVLAGPFGIGVVRARAVVDATGNADVAAAAGAPVVDIGADHVAVQGTGLSPRDPGAHYTNSDHAFSDDTDIVDATSFAVASKLKYDHAFDLAQLIDSRQRRQIVGETVLDPVDFLFARTFPDSICLSASNFDSHGFTVHPIFTVQPPTKEELRVFVPYRSLVPRGLDGVLVTGLGMSAHRDALPVVRMQPDVQNQGYAAGAAAAQAVATGSGVRRLDVRALQRHLIEIGNLPEQVLTDVDSFPLPAAELERAVEAGCATHKDLAVVFAHAEACRPRLRTALEAAVAAKDWGRRQRLALVLGMLGDAAAAGPLAAMVETRAWWDPGWNFRGMDQFGMSLSGLDSLVIALGRTGDAQGLPPVLRLARLLHTQCELSHARAIAEAAPHLARHDRRGDLAAALARVLRLPGHAGHDKRSQADRQRDLSPSRVDHETRTAELRELLLAVALFRCGDHQGVGETTLRRYAADLHGHYARHASAVLAGG